jgi:hypothetical protein
MLDVLGKRKDLRSLENTGIYVPWKAQGSAFPGKHRDLRSLESARICDWMLEYGF